MKIQLIGFDYELNPNNKMDILVDAVNASNADLILFPARTLRDMNDLFYAEQDITNKQSVAILEVEESMPTSCLLMHRALYMLHTGLFFDLYTSQLFETEEDIEGNEAIVDKLMDEMRRRQFACCGNRISVLQGGETAIVSGTGTSVDFRFSGNTVLSRRYQGMLASTDIFLNPVAGMTEPRSAASQRLAALSAGGRWCLTTGTLDRDRMGSFTDKGLQRIFHDGKEISVKPEIFAEEGYVSRTVDIPDRVAPWPTNTPS